MSIKPILYKLRLEPDLETFVLTGRTEIEIELEETVSEITLDAVGLEIGSCSIRAEGERRQRAEPSPPDPEKQSFTVTLPRPLSGRVILEIDYRGRISDDLLGFYRSRWRDRDGVEKYIAVTQFEEDYARRAFPCFDRPDRKAAFDIEFVIAPGLLGLSNMPVESEKRLPDGRRLVRFERTPRMSTYLLFFGVGDFECYEEEGDPLVRAFTTPGKIHLAREGVAFARRCLDYFTEHFGTPYPLPKLDLIAVPDFAFGAMENWGAMTFRENLMLVYPGITSRKALERLFEVIAHEIVHQWFGDLVSPADWKYLWLNESFATLYGNLAVDWAYPEWKTMESYLLDTSASAMSRDALKSSFAIELGEEARITASTAPIIYDKGGSILRMAISWLGDLVRTALADYFVRFSYDTAVSSDLWEAMGRTAGDEKVSNMMKSWVEQPGYPLLRVRRTGGMLSVRQERFTYLDENPQTGAWIIPLSLLVVDTAGKKHEIKRLLDGPSIEIPLGEDAAAFKLNLGEAGFYRTAYEPDELARLARLAADRVLSGPDRYGLQNDVFALVRRGELGVADYLDLVSKSYMEEDHPLPLQGILRNLAFLDLVLEAPGREAARKIGLPLTRRILERIGRRPAQEEPLPITALRSAALWRAVLQEDDPSIAFCLEAYESTAGGGASPHPDIADAVWRTAAALEPRAFAYLKQRFLSSESEEERMVLSAALGCVSPERMEEALDFAFESLPPALRFVPLSVMAGHPGLAPQLLDAFLHDRVRWESLHPAHFERVMVGVISVGGLGRDQEAREFFSEYAPESLGAYLRYFRETVTMALEILEVNTRLRRA